MASDPGRQATLTRAFRAAVTAASLTALVCGCGTGDRVARPDVPVTSQRYVIVEPFDANDLPDDRRWLGPGVAHLVSFGLREHPALVLVGRDRASVIRGVDVVRLSGRISQRGAAVVIQPTLVRHRQTIQLESLTTSESELETSVMKVTAAYPVALQLTALDTASLRMRRAVRVPRLRALELFTHGHAEFDRGADEQAVQTLGRAIEADPNFVMAQYMLGAVHMKLGNRWKCAAQMRAAWQLDSTMPEPLKALGDLFLAQPRVLFEQAIEAYSKAIEVRPFYSEAHVGLGEAKMVKGDLDGAIAAYSKAVTFDPLNAGTYLKLGAAYAARGSCAESSSAHRRARELDSRSAAAHVPCPAAAKP